MSVDRKFELSTISRDRSDRPTIPSPDDVSSTSPDSIGLHTNKGQGCSLSSSTRSQLRVGACSRDQQSMGVGDVKQNPVQSTSADRSSGARLASAKRRVCLICGCTTLTLPFGIRWADMRSLRLGPSQIWMHINVQSRRQLPPQSMLRRQDATSNDERSRANAHSTWLTRLSAQLLPQRKDEWHDVDCHAATERQTA